MSKPLAEKIALVTGASRGIGRATAIALARAGAHIVAVARTVGALEEIDDAARAAGSSATLVPLDIRDYAGICRLGGFHHLGRRHSRARLYRRVSDIEGRAQRALPRLCRGNRVDRDPRKFI